MQIDTVQGLREDIEAHLVQIYRKLQDIEDLLAELIKEYQGEQN